MTSGVHADAAAALSTGRKRATRSGDAIEVIGVLFNEAAFGSLDPKQTTITLPPAAPSFSAYFLAVFNADGDF